MKTYKSKAGKRVVEAVQYEGSYGQKRGLSFYLRKFGLSVEHMGSSNLKIGNSILYPGAWLIVKGEANARISTQIMTDDDFRMAYKVTHG